MPKQISQKPAQSQSQPKYQPGHFDKNGTSQGQQTGAVRKSPDACNDRKEQK